MSEIKINKTNSINLEKLLESRLLVQANSGGGKSWLLRRLLEQSHGKVQQIVLDPEGEFSSLREKYEYILAGKDSDVPAEPRSAALLAHKLLELNVSAIIDLYELHPQERKHFVHLFLDAMVNSPKNLHHPCLVIIDEAHTFVPEKGESEAANAVIGLASLGRKRGFCAVLATQRISKLHKDAAAECNNKLIGRTGLDIDRKRAGEELGFTGKEEFLSLRTLKPGEFYGFGPAISDEVIKVQVGEVLTSHPTAGARALVKTVPPTDKIKKVLAQLSDLPAEAKKQAQTAAELKAENTELKRQLSSAKNLPGARTVKIEKVEVPIIGKRSIDKLKLSESSLRKLVKAMKEAGSIFEVGVDKFSKDLSKAMEITNAAKQLPATPINVLPAISAKTTSKIDPGREEIVQHDVRLNEGEKKILIAIAQFPDGTNGSHIAILTGYRQTSRRVYLQKLKSRGLIEIRGDNFKVTQLGIEILGDDFKQMPTGKELQNYLMLNLPEGEKKIFAVVSKAYPAVVSREVIESETGYKITSVRVYLQNLKARKVIEVEDGMVKAANSLFE